MKQYPFHSFPACVLKIPISIVPYFCLDPPLMQLQLSAFTKGISNTYYIQIYYAMLWDLIAVNGMQP